MNRPHVGIIGGLVIFLVILSFIIYNHSDFDTQLIEQVNNNVPADKLFIQIDEETEKMQINAKRRLDAIMMDKRNWGNGSFASKNDYQLYVSSYESEMKIISDYDSLRKKFAKREITKREFLDQIKIIKEYFKLYS
ncbi:MAG: hypothetical protein LLF83_05720 [Methanobacterium sp.]|nr:hypothetical protein [Methanobacterium sp.]